MHQFLHYNTYGAAPRKGAGGWANINGILAEASRLPAAVGHLHRPVAPLLLYGVLPTDIEADALALYTEAVDEVDRSVRHDAAILVAGAISYPLKREQVESDPAEMLRFGEWRDSVLDFLAAKHCGRLKSVVQHNDERFLHLHFFTLPELRDNKKINWVDAHPGLEAKRFSAARGETAPKQDSEYRLAMRSVQDQFYEFVSKRFGHDRVGPARQREGRRTAKVRQEAQAAEEEWEREKQRLNTEREQDKARHERELAAVRQIAIEALQAKELAEGLLKEFRLRKNVLRNDGTLLEKFLGRTMTAVELQLIQATPPAVADEPQKNAAEVDGQSVMPAC